ncbi:MAG TPA: MFS transporter [Chloroflexota bacterium]|nr:MFS transporter [Chloroflexota bacterium]
MASSDSSDTDPRWRRAARTVSLDVRPLHHREFRLLFVGRTVALSGGAIMIVALPFQIYHLTHSSLAVGLLGLFEIIPILLIAFAAGAAADAWDRRRTVLVTEVAMCLAIAVLIANSLLSHPNLWVVYGAATALAAFDALQGPSLTALMPRLVPKDELPAATALTSLRSTASMTVGPAIAGILIATIGVTGAYGVDAMTCIAGLGALWLMRAVPPPSDAERPSMERILEGLSYARGRPELMGTYLVDIVAMFFGMPTALFPALAVRFGGPSVLGALMAAPAVGSFLAVATSGWTKHIRRQGLGVALAALAWGVAIVLFGLSPSLVPALVFLALAGAADMISGIFRSTIWNVTIPDALRGRLAGIEMVSYSIGPALGDVESGTVGTLFSVPVAIVSGGVLCVLGTIALSAALPSLLRFDVRQYGEKTAA